MRGRFCYALLCLLVLMPALHPQAAQISINEVSNYPAIPSPFNMRNWRQVALDFDAFVFNPTASGTYLPLMWWDDTKVNWPQTGFGLPTYVGHYSQYQYRGNSHEGIVCMGALLSGTLVGINQANKTGPGYSNANLVAMCEDYFNSANGENVFLNYSSTSTGSTFWYELLPSMLIAQLLDYYPNVGGLESKLYTTADKLYNAAYYMGGSGGTPNFDYTACNLKTYTPIYNGLWREPDSSAGMAYLGYVAYKKWGQPQHLTLAQWGLNYLQNRTTSPLYEVLLVYGAYTAARMNAEMGTTYDVTKMLNWCVSGSVPRSGWGTINQRWGSEDCYGLMGSRSDGGGYAFAFNGFYSAGALVPLVRYDNRYARAIGKWMLHLSNASRLYYSNYISSTYQSSYNLFPGDTNHVVPYEGLRKTYNSKSPFAMADALGGGWAPTDYSLYSGAFVGFLGGLLSSTNNTQILQLDCLKTDFHGDLAYPTYLYYNPHAGAAWVNIDVGATASSLWDGVSNTWKRTNVSGVTNFQVPANSAAVIVVVPANGTITTQGTKVLVNNVVIDWRNND